MKYNTLSFFVGCSIISILMLIYILTLGLFTLSIIIHETSFKLPGLVDKMIRHREKIGTKKEFGTFSCYYYHGS